MVCIILGVSGDVTCMATIPADMEVEAHFLAKEDGVVAGIALAEMVFHEVDPSLTVLPPSLPLSLSLMSRSFLILNV